MSDRTELERLLEAAKTHIMSPRERWLQRVSWAYGQLMEVPGITREHVEKAAIDAYGPCPTEDLTDEDFDDLYHALGRPGTFKEAYRNYYCCGANSETARRFEALGCWDFVRYINTHRGDDKDAIYEVNGLGKQLVAEWMRKRDGQGNA